MLDAAAEDNHTSTMAREFTELDSYNQDNLRYDRYPKGCNGSGGCAALAPGSLEYNRDGHW